MKTYVVKIDPKRPDRAKIESAAKAVREGRREKCRDTGAADTRG